MTSRDNHHVREAAQDVRHNAAHFASTAGKAVETLGQQMRAGTAAAAATTPQAIDILRSSVDDIIEWIPEATSAARVGVMATTESMRGIPDQTLRTVAAVSVGMGIGLYLAGAPRPVTLAAVVPAALVATFMALDEPMRKHARS
jgi:hypothetical protein